MANRLLCGEKSTLAILLGAILCGERGTLTILLGSNTLWGERYFVELLIVTLLGIPLLCWKC